MQAKPLSARNRKRPWWQGFTARIMLTTSAMSLLVIIITSLFSYNALRNMSLKVAHQALDGQASTLRHDIESRVTSLVASIHELSSNSLIANALADDLGRSVYLQNFIDGFSSAEGFNVKVAMTDFRGRTISTNRPDIELLLPASWMKGVIERAQGAGELVVANGVPFLLLAEPIIFRNTGTAEGGLIFQINLSEWLNFEAIARIFTKETWLSSLELNVTGDPSGRIPHQTMVDATGDERPWTSVSVVLPDHIRGEQLNIELKTQRSFVQQPLRELVANVLTMSMTIFIVILLGSFILVRTQTRKLVRLQSEAEKISQVKFQKIHFSSDGRDEIDDLAEAFNLLVDELRGAYRQLENEAEHEINVREARYQSIINNSAECIITLSKQGIIETFNPSAQKTFGYSEEEAVGQSISTLMPAHEREAHDEYLRMSNIHAPRIINRARDIYGLRKSGETFPLELTVSPMELDGEEKFIGILRDISERKKFEEGINLARIEAEQANMAKTQFLSNMSHEIRTPMNAIINLSHLALQGELEPQQRNYIEKVEQSGSSLLGLINQILDFSKIEAGKLELESIPFNLNRLVASVMEIFEISAEEKGLVLKCEQSQLVHHHLIGDELRLRQILTNLINNAIKFTDKGSVTLTIKEQPLDAVSTTIEFTVADTGIGISEEQKPRIFKTFQQADSSTTRKYGGSGLGLVISKQLLELMGGEIRVDSSYGNGTNFIFTLPLGIASAQDVQSSLEDSAKGSGEGEIPTLEKAEVLLVDDNKINQLIASDILTKANLHVLVANNGAEAVELVRTHRFALVLMDLQMPVMDGFDATREIRKFSSSSELPIIAMTADAMLDVKKRCLAIGMNGYVSKPIDIGQLFTEVSKWLAPLNELASEQQSTSEPEGEKMIMVEGITMDELMARVGGNTELVLTILRKFRESNADSVALIHDAIVQDDLELAQARVHSLKGVAGNISAAPLFETAKRLEADIMGKSGHYSEHLQLLKQELDSLFAAIAQLDMSDQ